MRRVGRWRNARAPGEQQRGNGQQSRHCTGPPVHHCVKSANPAIVGGAGGPVLIQLSAAEAIANAPTGATRLPSCMHGPAQDRVSTPTYPLQGCTPTCSIHAVLVDGSRSISTDPLGHVLAGIVMAGGQGVAASAGITERLVQENTSDVPLIATLIAGHSVEPPPGGPAGPTAPVGPTTPAGPCGPAGPGGPGGPIGPIAPGSPATPGGPTAPVAPVAPVDPVLPAAPGAPAGPPGPAAPVAPVAPVGAMQVNVPIVAGGTGGIIVRQPPRRSVAK